MDSQDNQENIKVYEKGDFNLDEFDKKDRRWKNNNVFMSLHFALAGIFTAVKEERNMRRHLVATLFVVLAGIIFQVGRIDWLFLFMAIFLVIAGELFNSAIENVVDLASDYKFYMRAKRAKDMAAGAVLVLSGFAVIVGLFVFLPAIWNFIFK